MAFLPKGMLTWKMKREKLEILRQLILFQVPEISLLKTLVIKMMQKVFTEVHQGPH